MADSRDRPWWATAAKLRLSEGRIVGIDGSMWAYRAVPMLPVVDARTDQHKVSAAAPLVTACEDLARMATTTLGRRRLNRGSYREIHILTVNIPDRYRAPSGVTNAAQLNTDFGDQFVTRRITVLGVKLTPQMRRKNKGPIRGAIDSVAESLVTGTIPLEDYEADFDTVNALLTRAGLVPAPAAALDLALAWWNFGANPDTPLLVHADHVHVFRSVQAMRTAAQLPVDECGDWRVTGEFPITFASVATFDTEWRELTDPRVLWASDLLDANARAISVRALIEPSKVTSGEIRRNISKYQNDINDRVAAGKASKSEQENDLAVLEHIEQAYAATGGAPTLHDAQVTVALDGVVPDLAAFLPDSLVTLGSLAFRQRAAMGEQMIASAIRANPMSHDLPAQAVAASGLSSLSTVGDPDGALLGLTEFDRQPVYISPSAVSDTDALPLMVIAGSTGSGKTMAMLHLARQWSAIRNRRGELTPVIFVDPKAQSDFSDAVSALGGTVYSLDDLSSADGVFDPLRVMATPADGLDLAAAMLGEISPWPDGSRPHEVGMLKALRFGVEHGARSIGHALKIAADAGQVSAATADPVFDLLNASPLFRAIFGTRDDSATLRAAEGITLIKVGAQALTLPQPGDPAPGLVPRIAQWVLRMMVYGSAAAVQGRQGVVMLDEAWQFVQGPAGAAEVQRLGRLARSMQVLPVLASQRIVDFTRAELQGYVSRGLILGLERGRGYLGDGSVDHGEAGAALDLFKIARTEDRLGRMAASQWMEGSRQPNWHSLKALRDPDTGAVLRGSVAYCVDLSGRVVPVEVTIPADFLREISTTATDVDARTNAQGAPPA